MEEQPQKTSNLYFPRPIRIGFYIMAAAFFGRAYWGLNEQIQPSNALEHIVCGLEAVKISTEVSLIMGGGYGLCAGILTRLGVSPQTRPTDDKSPPQRG